MDSNLVIFVLGIIWSMLWTGLATWKAARRGENIWFIFLFVLNSMGILPIIYLIIKRNDD